MTTPYITIIGKKLPSPHFYPQGSDEFGNRKFQIFPRVFVVYFNRSCITIPQGQNSKTVSGILPRRHGFNSEAADMGFIGEK